MVLIFFSILPFPRTTLASIYYVSPEGDGTDGLSWTSAYSSIGEALEVSESGDAIFIRSGTYEEAINLVSGVGLYGGFAGNEAPNEFDLRDWVANPTVLDGSGTGATIVTATAIIDTTLDGLTLTRGSHGISCVSSTLTLSYCTISENEAKETPGKGAGICCRSSRLVLHFCDIVRNRVLERERVTEECCFGGHSIRTDTFPAHGGGIFAASSSSLNLFSCLIEMNSGNRGGGIYSDESIIHLDQCHIIENSAPHGKFEEVLLSLSNTSTRDPDPGVGGGLSLNNGSTASLSQCYIRGNRSTRGAGIYMNRSAMQSNGTSIEANEGERLLRQEWRTPSNPLAGTTYYEAVIFSEGGGILCENRSSLTLENCDLNDNQAGKGGGLLIRDSSTETRNCRINKNTVIEGWNLVQNLEQFLYEYTQVPSLGGGALFIDSQIVMESNLFRYDSANEGGGIKLSGSNLMMADSQIETCTSDIGAGIHATESYLVITACSLKKNFAGDGSSGVDLEDCIGIFNNALFSENDPMLASFRKANIHFAGCTVLNNKAWQGRAAIEASSSEVNITNSILWNEGQEIMGDDFRISYSDIKGGWTGPGNIDVDPMFLDIAAGDYRLATDSSCIDSGTRVALARDILGNSRPYDTPGVGRDGTGDEFDMGAYEHPVGNPPPTRPPADADLNGFVGSGDLFYYSLYWNLPTNEWFGPTDLKADGTIDLRDIHRFLEFWKQE